MAARNKMTVSIVPTKYRPNGAERRDALNASLATEQADLKREAGVRRAKRAARENALSRNAPEALHSSQDRDR
jgi:hypothetical protein